MIKNNIGNVVQFQKPNSHCLLYSVAADSSQAKPQDKRKRKYKREKRKQDDNL